MEAQILLADAAQTAEGGKVHALGLGWTATTTPLPPQAVVILMRVPWDQSNVEHHAVVRMLDEDGRPVTVAGPFGEEIPLQVEAQFETGRPAGVPRGIPLDVPLTFGVGGGLPIAPGRYEWVLSIDGETQPAWRVGFLVRSPREVAGF